MQNLKSACSEEAGSLLWPLAPASFGDVHRIAMRHGLPEMIARILCARGVQEEDIDSFLHPSLRQNFPDPFRLAGMRALAEDLADWIEHKKNLAIFGDFDVDGATSSAVLGRFLRHFGLEVPVWIPDRKTEGYGPNIQALQTLRKAGAEIAILVDCGTVAFDTIAQAHDIGLGIVVLDHHEAEETLPTALHIINPKRRDDESTLDIMAAVGVTFMACVATTSVLRERGFFRNEEIPEPPLKNWLDLVALGTVCDMVPLTSVNRLFVRTGLERMVAFENPGIRALANMAGDLRTLEAEDLGYLIGPRINAGSRIHKADLGARILSTDNAEEALEISGTLERCNEERKAIQSRMTDRALALLEAQDISDVPVLFVADRESEDWHSGLIGLVAGDLKKRFGKPACAVAWIDTGYGELEGRGSGRSVRGVDLAAAFLDARNAGLLLKGGGHAMAGGFTLSPGHEEAFKAFLMDHISRQTQGKTAPQEEVIVLDGILSVSGLTLGLAKHLRSALGPFGMGNPEPVFGLRQVRVHRADIVGQRHIRCDISDWEGGPRIKGIAFNSVGTSLGERLLNAGTDGHSPPLDVAATIKINAWRGRETVELLIQDAA